MTFARVEHIGPATLYLGDCRIVVPSLDRADILCSDPPYGQKQNTNIRGLGGVRRMPPRAGKRAVDHALRSRASGVRTDARYKEGIKGDDAPFDPAPWISIADRVLLWGAHRFAERLPRGSWLVWDKVPTGKVRSQGDGEAAWINDAEPKPMRIFRLLWDGVCVGPAARAEVTAGQKRVHPMQKPVALMAWCLERLTGDTDGGGRMVLDPYMGSGSTGVAAVRAGYRFTGVEFEVEYFETACARIAEAARQGRLL